MSVYVITVLILFFYIALAWFAGALLQLHGTALWVFRGGLIFIGVLGAGLFLWFHHRMKRAKSATPSQFAALAEQVKVLLRQAEQKLVEGKRASLRSLPIVFVLGDLNSAKTSSIVHCGLGPELIAGHVFSDGDIVPTASINVWFARETVFIEVGGKLAANPHLWAQVLRQTRPKRVPAAVGKGQQAPRAALVCLDCERLSSAQAPVQNLAGRLKEMARSLGAPFPVYVLFTKMDRLPHFAEFVGNLTSEESAQVLGATLPRQNIQGVFAEEESRRLAKAMDQIIYSLAEKRLEYLGRETVSEKLAGIYEFPRELRKSRNQAVQLLVELTRPTQLSANPFLRGFYFSGVRAILINESVQVPNMARTAAVSGSGATRMFVIGQDIPGAGENAPRRTEQSRKVPEWTFLPHLFTEVVLADHVAFAASHQSTRVDRLRQILIASVAAISLFFAIALLISFIKNRSLENQIAREAERLNTISAGVVIETPTLEQLRQLEELRQMLETLTRYRTSGPPLSYRYGLYSGNKIYPDAYSLYFQNFRRLLLALTQSRMIARMKNLPASPAPTDEFASAYNLLKAYLITTSRHDKSTRDFLAPALLDYWSSERAIDPERMGLAKIQFEFFSEQLPRLTESTSEADSAAILNARRYLTQFNGLERIYQELLSVAGRKTTSINFNLLYPDTVAIVGNSHEIPGAFTRIGYVAMQEILKSPARYFGGEEWVIGDGQPPPPMEILREKLRKRYLADFAGQWRVFLNATVMTHRYANIQDAAGKLKVLSSNASPLLELFSVVAQNTAVDSSVITDEFQPTQLMAPNPQLLVGGTNQPYMNGLLGLQTNVVGLAAAYPHGTTDASATAPVQQAAITAIAAVGQIAQSFRVDNEAHVDGQVRSLMERPITAVQALIGDVVPKALNAGGEGLCAQFRAVAAKYPFNLGATQEATLEDLKFFQPSSGTLWSFYDSNLKAIALRQGPQFVQSPAASVRISPQFLNFLSRAATITDTFFPQQSLSPHLSYMLRQAPNKGIDQLNLTIDGKTLSGSGHSLEFEWPGTGTGVTLTGNSSGGGQLLFPSYPGQWGAFHFFQRARWSSSIGGQMLEWPIEVAGQPITLPDGSALVLRYELQGTAAQILHGSLLEGLRCPSVGAH